MQAGGSALARCVGPEGEFLSDYWGKRPLLREQLAPDAYADLLTLADVDELVTTSGLRTPEFRLVKAGTPLPSATYTTTPSISGVPITGLADVRKVLAEIDDGATLVLQGMHRYRASLRAFCRELEDALGCPCQVNAYFTPPGTRGLALHKDTHDVFVLQCFGQKRWEIHAPDGVWDITLKPGDALYMPKGTPHAATAQDALSGHLTIGLLTDPIRTVLSGVVATALADAAFDERLPTGWQEHPDLLATALKDAIGELTAKLTAVDMTRVAVRRADRFRTKRPPMLAGSLVDRTRLTGLTGESVVRRRPGSTLTTRVDGDRLVLLLGDRVLRLPAWTSTAVSMLADGDVHRVDDIPGIDAAGRQVLARRLVREGLLEVIA
jgi:ribosomal protein L16 Arg81 hydroxylase